MIKIKTFIYFLIGLFVFASLWCYYTDKDILLKKELSSEGNIEFVDSGSDIMLNSESGVIDAENLTAQELELIPPDDIAASPGYGYGPGTIGFGRYGSSFMI